MNQSNKDRILEISKNLKLAHIGSNLSCLPILEEIYAKKKPEDIVILDNAHAHLAHLVVKEETRYKGMVKPTVVKENLFTETLIQQFGIHCDRKAGCDASGGSLGHGLGIGIGYALADKSRDVYVIVSDGSMMEGSNWEALRICENLGLKNIHICLNYNGFTAVQVSDPLLLLRIEAFSKRAFSKRVHVHFTHNGEGFKGVQGHYKVL